MKPPRTKNVAEKASNAKALQQQRSENDAANGEREMSNKERAKKAAQRMQRRKHS